MKKMLGILLAFILLGLTGCGHKHTWIDDTCTAPKTCSECGATEGEAKGHDWVEATCTEPKKCSACGETEGAPKGHVWSEATCSEAKTCTVCGQTEGEPLGHTKQFGKCDRCGELQGKDVILEFSNRLNAIPEPDPNVIQGKYVDEMYPGCMVNYNQYVKYSEEIERIINDYKQYEELSPLISELEQIVQMTPSQPIATVNGVNGYLDEAAAYNLKYADFFDHLAEFLGTMIA